MVDCGVVRAVSDLLSVDKESLFGLADEDECSRPPMKMSNLALLIVLMNEGRVVDGNE